MGRRYEPEARREAGNEANVIHNDISTTLPGG